jgi:AAA ATPase domain
LRSLGVRPIWYPAGRYELIEGLLAHIAERASPETRGRWAETADEVARLVRDRTALFVGRDVELRALDDYARSSSGAVMLVTGGAGAGKSALLAHWVTECERGNERVAYHAFSRERGITSIARAYLNLLRQVRAHSARSGAPLPETDDETALRDELYQSVAQWGRHNATPLTVVLDGLDEAERDFRPPFPLPLTERVHAIASARAEVGEEPAYVRGWADGAARLAVGALGTDAIADWLRAADGHALDAAAEDRELVMQIEARTQGLALYIY